MRAGFARSDLRLPGARGKADFRGRRCGMVSQLAVGMLAWLAWGSVATRFRSAAPEFGAS